MIQSLEITNFRCFKHLLLKELSRINVIVGPNGSGKTAFLESLFIASGGSPELALRVRNFRGMGTAVEPSGPEGLEGIWKNLFHKFDQSKPVSIDLRATDQKSRRLTVSLGDTEAMSLPLQPVRGFRPGKGRPQRQTAEVKSAIKFIWTDAFGNEFVSSPTVSDDKLSIPQARSSNRVVFVPSNFKLRPEEAAKRLSSLSRKNAAEDLVQVLTGVYSDLEGISVENNDGNWEVFVKVKYLDERIPMALHSSGASRLISIMLAISSVQDGVALIDEIENGFYYKKLPEIWRVIHSLAEVFNCQVFISTHSRECLQAIAPMLRKHASDFTLLNVNADEEGVGSVRLSSGEVMGAALESGFEVR
jgi:predicted ATPase